MSWRPPKKSRPPAPWERLAVLAFRYLRLARRLGDQGRAEFNDGSFEHLDLQGFGADARGLGKFGAYAGDFALARLEIRQGVPNSRYECSARGAVNRSDHGPEALEG